MTNAPVRVVLVTGLSGAGRSSILRVLEDLGYEAVDNPPLALLEDLVTKQAGLGQRRLAVGVDARTSGFDTDAVLAVLRRLRANPSLRPELLYALADEAVLLGRYTETRRRHPLAPQRRVADGIAAEIRLTAPLRAEADLVLDTSDLPLPALRHRVEELFGDNGQAAGLTVMLLSFAFPAGLPREADMVFDARFLRNPHYDPILRHRTGLEREVGAYVEADPDFAGFFRHVSELLDLVLPRFVQEGKKYATIAVGCSGGRHRSVHIVEKLAAHLARAPVPAGEEPNWKVTVTHRELARGNGHGPRQDGSQGGPRPALIPPVQAQEA